MKKYNPKHQQEDKRRKSPPQGGSSSQGKRMNENNFKKIKFGMVKEQKAHILFNNHTR